MTYDQLKFEINKMELGFFYEEGFIGIGNLDSNKRLLYLNPLTEFNNSSVNINLENLNNYKHIKLNTVIDLINELFKTPVKERGLLLKPFKIKY